MSSAVSNDLLSSLQLLTVKLAGCVMDVDWTVPEDVAATERALKVLSIYGRTIEKCVTMTKDQKANDIAPDRRAEIETLRKDLLQRLDRYAERTGAEDLRRRVQSRGFDPDALRLELLGED